MRYYTKKPTQNNFALKRSCWGELSICSFFCNTYNIFNVLQLKGILHYEGGIITVRLYDMFSAPPMSSSTK